jgi:DNA-binding NtrC family response regulator/predicted ATPase
MTRRRLSAMSHPTDRLVGHSPSIRALRAQIRRLVAFDTIGNPSVPTLLLQGETGTGKGLVARIIHDSGPRTHGPFIEVNCAAIPDTLLESELFGFEAGAFTDAQRAKPGLFEAASGGTLFLDEIDALPMPLQGKLLKAIEEKRLRRLGAVVDHPVDVKLIAATQMGLGGRVAEGRFRPDLYHRLAVVILELLPLRQLGKDIAVLAEHFLRQYAVAHGLSPKRLSRDAKAWLLRHAWPGNVRELSHLMERATLLCPEATLDPHTLERLCLSFSSAQVEPLPAHGGWELLDELARIRHALRRTQGNVVAAARLLGLSRSALRYRLRRYGIGRSQSLAPDDNNPHPNPLPGRERGQGKGSLPEGEGDHVVPSPHQAEGQPLISSSYQEQGPPLLPSPHQADGQPLTPSPHRGEGEGANAAGVPGVLSSVEMQADASAWEQKPVAVLAIDLVFPKIMGAETPHYEPWTVASRWERTIAEKVHGFGGIVLQSGPSLLVMAFGIPHTLDQMPQRAVQAAWAIQHLMTGDVLVASGEPCPKLRLAVHLGEVLVDARASSPTGRLLAVDDVLSLPVRLLGLAAPGDILVSPQVGRVVEGWCELQARALPYGAANGEQASAYAVVGLKPRRVPMAMHGGYPLSRFVGREHELAALHEQLAQAERGRGQVVRIVGEPGVGKSRLLFEFQQRLTAHRVTWLEGRCLSYGSTIPFLPVLDLLKSCFHIEEHDDGQQVRDKLTRKVLTLDRSLEDTLPYLCSLLAVSEADSALQQMDPQIKRRRTFEAIKRLLLRESLNQPLLLFVEDLHWLDSESQALLVVLSESLTAARVLLLVTYRPEYQPAWNSNTSYTQLRLDPLEQEEAEELLTALLGERADVQGLKQLILAKSEGNPFFLEEIVQALTDQGVLVRSPGGEVGFKLASLVTPRAEIQLPRTVQGVLAARIDRLPAAEKALLQTLAVIGKRFPFSLLERVMEQPEGELYRLLTHLQGAEFIYEQAAFPELEYTFKHALTQEVAYNSLVPEQRRILHEYTAHAIEEIFHDRLEEHYNELAYHYRRSGNTMQAVVYLQRAGQQAVQQSAYAEAISHVGIALELLKSLPDTVARREQELALQIILGPALMATKGFGASEVEEVFTRARELCQEVGDTPQLYMVLQGLSGFYALRVKFQTLRELMEQRLSLAQRLQNPALLAQAHLAQGHGLLAFGELASARAHLEQGMALYNPEQHHSLAFGGGLDPSGRDHAALIRWLLGYPDQALESLHAVLTAVQKRPHAFSLAVALLFAAALHQLRREAPLAQERAEAAMTLSNQQGFAAFLAMGAILRGWALAEREQSAEGIAQIREGLDAWRAVGNELLRPYFLGLLAEAHGGAGQAEQGLLVLAEALATAHNTGERWWEAELHRLKGELLLLQAGGKGGSPTAHRTTATVAEVDMGEPGRSPPLVEAEPCLLQALAIAQRQQAKPLELRAAVSLGRLWQRQGKGDAARRLLAETYGWFTEGFDTADLQEAKALLDALS